MARFQTAGKNFDDKKPWAVILSLRLACPGTKVRGPLSQ